ncbi:unnamed protein product [Urochloa decumbens]|uniref:Uncharacterized protein n=1 Tax=Urochloa decumbens TaxID=240449 RepID=A0ABC9GZE6_9POAL
MDLKTISSHADLLALQGTSDEELCVQLLMDLRLYLCPRLDFLSLVASLSLELRRVEHDLLPPLQIEEAKLDEAYLEAVLLLKNSALTLLRLAKHVKQIEEVLGLLEEGLEHALSGRIKAVGISLVDIADHVLKGIDNIVWLKAHVLFLLKLVNDLLATPVRFRSF